MRKEGLYPWVIPNLSPGPLPDSEDSATLTPGAAGRDGGIPRVVQGVVQGVYRVVYRVVYTG